MAELYVPNKYLGINSRLDEIQASFLRIKLRHLNAITEKKREMASLYLNAKTGLDSSKFILPKVDSDCFDVYYLFTIRTKKRDELKQYLLNNEIKTEIHYPIAPINQEGYRNILQVQKPTPIAEEIHNTILSIPCSFGNTEEEIKQIINIMNKF